MKIKFFIICCLAFVLVGCGARTIEDTQEIQESKESLTSLEPQIIILEEKHKYTGAPFITDLVASTIETTIGSIEPTEATVETYTPILTDVWTTTRVNFRSAPSLKADIINTVEKGIKFTATDFNIANEWTFVRIEDAEGYIYTEYLSTIEIDKFDYIYYKVNRPYDVSMLPFELQRYGYELMVELNFTEYYIYWIVQCYQESRNTMHQSARAHDGYYDWGIMQIWEGAEHDKWSTLYDVIQNHPNYKTDPYDNIYCGIMQTYYWYSHNGYNLENAIGSYLIGTNEVNEQSLKYLSDVKSHLPYVCEVTNCD